MSGSANHRQRYRIILRGECQHLLSGILDGLAVESGRPVVPIAVTSARSSPAGAGPALWPRCAMSPNYMA